MTLTKKKKTVGKKATGAGEEKKKEVKKVTKKQEKKKEEEEETVAEDMELGDEPEPDMEEEEEEEEKMSKVKPKVSKKKEEKSGAALKKKKKTKKSDAEMEEEDEEEEEEDPISAGASVVSLKTKKSADNKEEQRVVYVGHLPTGFEEQELRSFFEQFGNVVAVTLGRSKRTGGSQHFGFVEFERADVAQIAAAAMNHYYLDHRRLDVSMAEEHVRDIHERHMPRSNERAGKKSKKGVDARPVRAASRHSDRVNEALERAIASARTEKGSDAIKKKLLLAQARRASKLQKAGIKGFSIPEPKRV